MRDGSKRAPGDFGVEAGLLLWLDFIQHHVPVPVLAKLLLGQHQGVGFNLTLYLLAFQLGLELELLHDDTLQNQDASILGHAEYSILDEAAGDFLHGLKPVNFGRRQQFRCQRFLQNGFF